MTKKILSICLFIFFIGCDRSNNMTIIVRNNSNFDRQHEIVSVPLHEIENLLGSDFVLKATDGTSITYQKTYDGFLIFPVDVEANSLVKYNVTIGTQDSCNDVCVAVYRSDCQDDVAWENDCGGYRLYGPIYKQSGGNVYGYDIWTKSVSYPILSKRYDDNMIRHISYHKDHGDGFDGYTVGPTLGAGMNALIGDDGEICYQVAYNKYEVLDSGPLRVTLKFVIDTLFVSNNESVVETRIISLDKGSWLNKCRVKYDGLANERKFVCGIVIHNDNKEYTLDCENNIMSYADFTDDLSADNGEIYVGVILPECDSLSYKAFPKTVANSDGQILSYGVCKPETFFEYYMGAGWSKGGVVSLCCWNNYLHNYSEKLKNPLVVKVK